MDVCDQVMETIDRFQMVSPGDGVVVGLSGGPDSLCLLHVLCRLRPRYALTLRAAHLHHGIRGADADEDAEFVREVAAALEIPIDVGRRDVPALAARHKLSLEEAARRARYGFLVRVARQAGARHVAVGHNADDQTETVLMHWLRGAGLAGLRGMLPVTYLTDMRLDPDDEVALEATEGTIRLVRPLLEVPRTEIERYCRERQLAPRFDRSNLDMTYFRNRLRLELIPYLETYNPNIREVVRRSAWVIADDYALLREGLRVAWADVIVSESAEAIVMDLAKWRLLPVSQQRATLREAIHRLRRSLRNINWVHVEDAMEVARHKETGAAATLPMGLALRLGYQRLVVADEGFDLPLEDLPALKVSLLPLQVPGVTWLPDSPWQVRLSLVARRDLPDGWERNADPWQAYLDASAAGSALALRTRRPGDRFQPLGLGGHEKPLREWLINAKVPRAQRSTVPLLVSPQHILWVAGGQIDERVKVQPETVQVLHVEFRRLEEGKDSPER